MMCGKNGAALLLSVVLAACSPVGENAHYPAPVAPAGAEAWIYDPLLSDEFDGPALDSAKWYDHNPTWPGRRPSLFRPENVRVEGGALILSGRREEVPDAPEGYHTFTSAAVQSRRKVLYGFFEIRCRPMKSALSSAFWLYVQDSVKQEEIDIFEICGRHDSDPSYPVTCFATSHYMLKTAGLHLSDHVAHTADRPWADREIVAGLKWTRDELVWYIDGQEIRCRRNDFWHSPETINFDSEAFPSWWGLPSEEDCGGEFRIEYFRYWRSPDAMRSVYDNDMGR